MEPAERPGIHALRASALGLALSGAAVLAACSADAPSPADPSDPDPVPTVQGLTCSIPMGQIYDSGVGRDGIPALTDPEVVAADHPAAEYIQPDDRVIGLRVGGTAVAVPHNILLWHEIVNLQVGELSVAVTYCPLTGSSLAFDRASAGGAELGVSGLLFANNLIMYDRNSTQSLWPQMMRESACGPRTGTVLQMVQATEMTWEGWSRLHPETRVVSDATGFSRPYTRSRYEDYERIDNRNTVFPMPRELDTRRPPKERVIGIPRGRDGGDAYPFELLSAAPLRAIALSLARRPAVLLWDSAASGGAVYFSRVGGKDLTFAAGSGTITDLETGSTWGVDGVATGGPLQGEELEPYSEAYVAFWFAWAHFHPHTAVWRQ